MISLPQKHILEGHLLTLPEQLSWQKGLTSKNQQGSKRSVCNKWATSFSCERFCKIAIIYKYHWCFFISTPVSVISTVCRSERIYWSSLFALLSITTHTDQKLNGGMGECEWRKRGERKKEKQRGWRGLFKRQKTVPKENLQTSTRTHRHCCAALQKALSFESYIFG